MIDNDQKLNVLVVEDNDALRASIIDILVENGHSALGLYCAEAVDDYRAQCVPDLYIVDLNLPGEDGLSLAKRVRHTDASAGIILITGRNNRTDRLKSFDSGADIYLAKPIAPSELLACIRSIGRRISAAQQRPGLCLNISRQSLRGPAGDVALTSTEMHLLVAMNRAADRTIERWQAMEHVDRGAKGLSRASLDMCISILRKKLATAGAQPPSILPVRGVGYKLCEGLTIER